MKKKHISDQVLALIFQAHLKHYEAIRNEIAQATNLQNEMANYSIAIVGGTVTLGAIGQPNILYQQPALLLVASLLLSALSWSMLEIEIRIHDYRRYIDQILRKKVQQLIGDESNPAYSVLRMELAEAFGGQAIRSAFRGVLVIGKFLVAYIPDIVFIVFFLSLGNFSFSSMAPHELALFIFAILMAVVVPLGLMVNALFVTGYYREQSNKERRQPLRNSTE